MSNYTEAEVLNAIKTMGLFRTPYPKEIVENVVFKALEIEDRLEYAYHNAFGIDLEKCTKYGNESAEQQRDSYSTVMMYEVANVFDDILGEY